MSLWNRGLQREAFALFRQTVKPGELSAITKICDLCPEPTFVWASGSGWRELIVSPFEGHSQPRIIRLTITSNVCVHGLRKRDWLALGLPADRWDRFACLQQPGQKIVELTVTRDEVLSAASWLGESFNEVCVQGSRHGPPAPFKVRVNWRGALYRGADAFAYGWSEAAYNNTIQQLGWEFTGSRFQRNFQGGFSFFDEPDQETTFWTKLVSENGLGV